jgi:SAM-dependent methyltransferase
MKTQAVRNQKGEIDFRKKLYQQQVDGVGIFDSEFDAAGIERILAGRMQKTLGQMRSLKESGIPLSPYVEIGAERCQRSLVMETDLGAHGAAVDISYDLLRSCDHYRNVFKKTGSPIRICCDANNLPFGANSIAFIFCYETLHHFPEPLAITREMYRTLAPGGYFFFDEEPYKQTLHVNLYRGNKMYSKESLNRSTVRRALDRFFCAQTCNEVGHGILENDQISIESWKQALQLFDERDIELRPTAYLPLRSKLFDPASRITFLAAYLLGGNVSGVCRKSGEDVGGNRSIYDALICPSCQQTGSAVHLKRRSASFLCPHCLKTYPVVDEVLFLFEYEKFAQLYPEVFDSLRKEKAALRENSSGAAF